MPKPDLDSAYALSGTDEARKFYKDWADDYDRSFAEARGYRSPAEVARVFRAATRDNEPVLDVGAGTGLIGQELASVEIDALDLSPEMLAVAGQKGVYRDLITADLTGPLDLPDAIYGGVVSAGTFTHGHVGPVCLPELLRITRPGAIFVCTVVPDVYDSAGFGSALARLVAQGRISPVRFHDFAIYDHADDGHADARGLIMEFHRI
ncbi:class I SAM-dependent methyltransferase [Rhodobacteraceae bacterium W635]|uniref:class I SAM-dependent DNA methyltransferase n=1 Tax=Nioella halotolerans TaxID=2303578 RepID=UPI000E3DE4AC|nr:class I SAM-dependent methyltransferase [Rhodobacteraceae bacterium W635]